MEIITKQNEVFQKANQLKLLEIHNLLSILTRYNDNLMEDCNDNFDLPQNQNLSDAEKIAIYHRIIKDIQQQTFEISTVLSTIQEQYNKIDDFLQNDLYNLKENNICN